MLFIVYLFANHFMSSDVAQAVNPILYISITLVVIFTLYQFVFSKGKYSTGKKPFKPSAQKKQNLSEPDKTVGNFAISTFFYINDWSDNVNTEKPLMTLGNNAVNSENCVNVTLQEMLNNIKITIDGEQNTVVIPNFPIQKWVCLTVSVYGNTLDVYLDGKLVKTHILSSYIPCKFNTLHFGGDPSFDGYLNLGKYIPYAVNPEQAYNLYMDGADFNILGNFFEDYKLKVAILENEHEEVSFTI